MRALSPCSRIACRVRAPRADQTRDSATAAIRCSSWPNRSSGAWSNAGTSTVCRPRPSKSPRRAHSAETRRPTPSRSAALGKGRLALVDIFCRETSPPRRTGDGSPRHRRLGLRSGARPIQQTVGPVQSATHYDTRCFTDRSMSTSVETVASFGAQVELGELANPGIERRIRAPRSCTLLKHLVAASRSAGTVQKRRGSPARPCPPLRQRTTAGPRRMAWCAGERPSTTSSSLAWQSRVLHPLRAYGVAERPQGAPRRGRRRRRCGASPPFDYAAWSRGTIERRVVRPDKHRGQPMRAASDRSRYIVSG